MTFARSLPLFAFLASLNGVSASLPSGFPVSGGHPDLSVTFLNNTVSPSGELIPREETASPPHITTPVWTYKKAGVVIVVDIDVHINGTDYEVLHLLSSNVTLGLDNSALVLPSTSEAPWAQPQPPPGDAPHRYTVLLFDQPEGFSVPEEFQSAVEMRLGFDVAGFVEAAGLGEPIAGNWFTVQNTSVAATGTVGAPAPTGTSGAGGYGTPEEFEGGAEQVGVKSAWWVGMGAALAVGLMAL